MNELIESSTEAVYVCSGHSAAEYLRHVTMAPPMSLVSQDFEVMANQLSLQKLDPAIRESSYKMAGPPVRQRYNAKARGSVAGGSSHKKRKNITKERTEEHAQDNDNDQHDAELEDATAGMSSKKRKRFESYMVCSNVCIHLAKVTDQEFDTGQKT